MIKPRVRVKARSVALLRLVETKREPSDDMMSVWEHFKSDVESGKMASIAMAGVLHDGRYSFGFHYDGSLLALSGATGALHHRIVRALDEA